MKAEKIILSFVAVLVGLIAAGVAFYLYQMTRTIPESKTKPLAIEKKPTPTPTPDKSNFLSIDSPKDEEVSDKAVISISGKTAKDATIIVSSENTDQVVKPSATGSFSLTTTIGSGTTLLHITAVFPNGDQTSVTRTITYSMENF